ncbi:MAG: hypothetical protein V1800_11045 [Candidatus Latescibacterota bacterium]
MRQGMSAHSGLMAVFMGLMLGAPSSDGVAQEIQLPINIRVQQVMVKTGSSFRFYLPNGEFHGRLLKAFNYVTLNADADYDVLTGDMGFGIGYAFPKLPLKPGIFFRDDLLFRPLDAETGAWNRKQGMAVKVEKKLWWRLFLRASFGNEQQKSPSKMRLMDMVSFLDRTVRIGLIGSEGEVWRAHLAVEKGLDFLGGDFCYTLVSMGFIGTYGTERDFGHTLDVRIEGNVTDAPSPRYYLGGRSTLIGYDNDEIWGNKRALFRNDLRLRVFKGKVGGRYLMCSGMDVLGRLDVGNAGGAEDLERLGRYKAGAAVGLSMDTILNAEVAIKVSAMVGSRLVGRRKARLYVGLGD